MRPTEHQDMGSKMQPVTERSNPLTQNIDVAPPVEIVNLLGLCEKEIFEGWQGSQGLFNQHVLSTVTKYAELAAEIIKSGDSGCIVLSGCGTSGRLAFMTARSFNMKLEESGRQPLYDYTIAGGDVSALFESREAPEDDPESGIKMLKQAAEGKKKVLYVGISCGLSAPFVAGQLEYCMDHPDVFIPLLIGFNPAHLARNNPVEKWDKTFLQVATRLLEECHTNRWPILNPIIGPEPITGSSRMKSGSATKILLETIFTMAHQMAFTPENVSNAESMFKAYSRVRDALYEKPDQLANVLQIGGACLTSGGRIVYLGSGSQGIVGVIDASECPPTYGSGFDDVRGFLDKGYNGFRNKEGDISHEVQISTEYFKKDVLPTLKGKDLVVFLLKEGDPLPDSDILNSSATIMLVQLFNGEYQVENINPGQSVIVELPRHDLVNIIGIKTIKDCQQFLIEIATKWLCNALTTGAHILKGKVYENFMVDVKVSNNKLFYRAIGIIQRFCECTQEEAGDFLIRSIYQTDDVQERIRQAPVSAHILRGSAMDKVVPVAMVMTLRRCNYQSAVATLKEFPVVRAALSQCLQSDR